MKKANIIITLALVAMVSSCADNHRNNNVKKAEIGTVAGAIGGALAAQNLGKGTGRTLSIAAGSLLGAFIGNNIGASLDKADMNFYRKTSQFALERNPSKKVSTWVNPDSGNSGTITPTKTILQDDKKTYCREFTQTITIGNKTEEAYGNACRAPDGTWKIVQQ